MGELTIWAGWVGGMAVGLYLLFQYWITNKPLGCSTSYGNMCGMVSRHHYFRTGEYESSNNWRIWFVSGLPLGGLLAAITSPDFTWSISFSMGEMYDSVLPETIAGKALVLILGGILMGIGARLAGGCTSGHAISGISFLNWPSMIAGGAFFAGGIMSVQTIFSLLG